MLQLYSWKWERSCPCWYGWNAVWNSSLEIGVEAGELERSTAMLALKALP